VKVALAGEILGVVGVFPDGDVLPPHAVNSASVHKVVKIRRLQLRSMLLTIPLLHEVLRRDLVTRVGESETGYRL
jgi:hypothetical protein